MDIMTAGGYDVSDDVPRTYAAMLCDAGWLMRTAFEAGGGLSHEQWIAGIESLGSSVESVVTFPSFYGPGRHDGVAAVRQVSYVQSCSCFQYRSGDIKV